MNKELEEFKSEIKDKIDEILNIDRHNMVKIEQLRELSEELKPKPEFIKGEHVLVPEDNITWVNDVFEYNRNDSTNYKFSCTCSLWRYCKKIKSLPIHMTDCNGTGDCPDNVRGDTLVYVLLTNGEYSGGVAHEFNWNHVVRYQILKDLNPQ